MQTALIIPVAGFALLPICAVILFFRRFRLLGRLGLREIAFPNRMQLQFIGILVCAPVLVALCFWRDFDPLVMFALSLTGVFGFSIALCDILLIRSGGVYANGIVWNTVAVFYDSIVSFRQLDPFTIELDGVDSTRRMLVFTDPSLVPLVLSRLESSVNALQEGQS